MTYSKLSIKNSSFNIVSNNMDPSRDATLTGTTLEVIVVGAQPGLSKQWYKGEWSEDSSNTPDCFSLNGETPHISSSSPQNEVCALCEHNAWGSSITPQGNKVKACSDIKRLAIIFADRLDDEVYLLQVTPSSLKNLNAYHKTLSMRGIVPEISKTIISFDNSVMFPKLEFKFGGLVSKDVQPFVDSLVGSDRVKQVTGEHVVITESPSTAEDFGFTVEVGYTINNESGGSNE